METSEPREGNGRPGGLERIREILLGDILVELERRLVRLDRYIANRSNELQQDVRHRTGVLEAHVRKEVEALSSRAAHEIGEHRDAHGKLEQRIARLEERLESQISRLEREAREQLLAQATSFLDELERVRNQLRTALVRELGVASESLEEGGEHAGAWSASH